MYKLIVVGGKLRGQEFILEKGDATIGSSDECSIHLPIEGISKNHALITVSDDACYIKDLDSSNGTFVGGKSIKSQTIQDKDRITLPDTIIQVVYVEEKKKIIKKKIEIDDSEQAFYNGGDAPGDHIGRIFHLFKYKVMSVLYGVNQEWEWRVIFSLLLTLFSVTTVTLIIYPILEDSRNLLLIETAKRGAHYADEISRLNASALERERFEVLDTSFLDKEEGVSSYELFDLQGRIVRPVSKMNEYIQDPFSNQAKQWAESSPESAGNLSYNRILGQGRIGIAQKILAFDTKQQKMTPVGIIAIIFEPTTLKIEATKNSKAYLEAIVTVGLVAIFFYGFIYFLSLRPIEEMNFQIEEVLRGKRKNLESRYLMIELEPLRNTVNAVLQRMRELNNEESDEEDFEEDAGYVNSLKEFLIGSGVPAIVLNSEKSVQALNVEAEDITGIRQSASEGENILDVSREKGFSATVVELCDNSANNMGSNQQGAYELSGVSYAIHVSALIGRDNFAKAFYITFIRE